MRKGNKEIVSLSLSPEVLNLLDNYRLNKGMTRSNALEYLIKSCAGKVTYNLNGETFKLMPLEEEFIGK